MRVCFLSAFEDSMQRDTAASIRVYNLAKGLIHCGNEVHVILAAEQTRSEWVDRIPVHRIRGFCPGIILKILRRLFGVSRSTSLYFYDILFVCRISRIISQSDIVQIEQQMAGGFLSPFIKKFLKKPVVIDCHDAFQALRVKQTSVLRKALETFQEKLAYKYADIVLTVSKAERNCLASYGVTDSKIRVVPNGVDTDSFVALPRVSRVSSRQDQNDLKGLNTVIFVGNMDYLPNREAVETLSLIIAPIVFRELGNTQFLVVGKNHGKIRLPNLIFKGFVDSVNALLAVSDVAVAPIYRGSGTRLKVLEYFSCGLPVVSTSVGVEGIDVTNGANVIIEDDPEQFASKIVELLKDKGMSLRVGEAARELVRKKYDWKEITCELNGVLLSRLNLAPAS